MNIARKASAQGGQQFTEADIPFLTDKIYQKFDSDNQHFKKSESQEIIRTLADLMGVHQPPQDDVLDLFNLLGINGDGALDEGEFNSLLKTFFKVLKENDFTLVLEPDTDILYRSTSLSSEAHRFHPKHIAQIAFSSNDTFIQGFS